MYQVSFDTCCADLYRQDSLHRDAPGDVCERCLFSTVHARLASHCNQSAEFQPRTSLDVHRGDTQLRVQIHTRTYAYTQELTHTHTNFSSRPPRRHATAGTHTHTHTNTGYICTYLHIYIYTYIYMGKRVFITNVKGTFLGMSESEEASKRR